MSRNLVSIIIPVFNERDSLAELHARIAAMAETRNEDFSIIFVDDGSTDGSTREILRLRDKDPRVGLIRHRINHGKSMALMQGFSAAQGDWAVTLDADLQDEPENIPLFLEKLADGLDLVNGRRVYRKDTFFRKWLSKIFNMITRLVVTTDVRDINCGFKGYSRRLYKRLELRGDLHRLIPLMAAMMGFSTVEVPVSHAPRKHGHSKYRAVRHRGLLDVIALSASWATRFRPFHVFVEAAFFFWLLALAGLITWFCVSMGWSDSTPGAKVFTTLALFLTGWFGFVGTLLPVAGFILEQIGSYTQTGEWRGQLVEKLILPEMRLSERLERNEDQV